MALPDLSRRLAEVRERIAARQAAAGRAGPVRIIAVTKGWGPEAIRAAHDAGLRDVGENRVQEAVVKQEAAGALPVNWHLIGHLQTNKARVAVQRFSMIHSVDSARLARALEREVAKVGRETLEVLLQVNLAREPQKFGCSEDDAADLAREIAALPRLALRGFMTMAPYEADEAEQRRVFGGLRLLRERLATAGLATEELSMGMSGDFEIAVEEGATILRLGTVLFGERPT